MDYIYKKAVEGYSVYLADTDAEFNIIITYPDGTNECIWSIMKGVRMATKDDAEPGRLVITIEGNDRTDVDFLRTKAVSMVEEYVDEVKAEGRLDDPDSVEVSWEWQDLEEDQIA